MKLQTGVNIKKATAATSSARMRFNAYALNNSCPAAVNEIASNRKNKYNELPIFGFTFTTDYSNDDQNDPNYLRGRKLCIAIENTQNEDEWKKYGGDNITL